MNILDLEVQRERRVEMLREAGSKRATGRWRSANGARAFSKLVGFLANVR